MTVRFGNFVLDPGTRQLQRAGETRHLPPKAFQLLDLLLTHRPNVVAKERIRSRLWPGTYVSDSTLATVVAELRAALDEDARAPRFLRTVHGIGYAFCVEAPESESQPSPQRGSVAFRLILEDREIALRTGQNLLGRVEDGVAWIEAATVSRRHARILIEEGRAILEDLDSKNGTFVNGQRISAPTLLAHGDVIRLGRFSLKLQALRSDRSTLTASD